MIFICDFWHIEMQKKKDETFDLGMINGLGRLQLELIAAQDKMPVYQKPLVNKMYANHQ